MSDEPRETLDTERMLLDFVSGRDIECPLCGYNLRDLTKTTCPECEHSLEMRVGVQRLTLLPFVLAITPGIFSGMCAVVLAVIIVVNFIMNAGTFVGVPLQIFILDLFGWLSGLFMLGLVAKRHRFLKAPLSKQRILAAAIWIVHVMFPVFLVLMILMFG